MWNESNGASEKCIENKWNGRKWNGEKMVILEGKKSSKIIHTLTHVSMWISVLDIVCIESIQK